MTENLTHPAGPAAEFVSASAAPSRTTRTPPKFPRDTDGFQAEVERRVAAYFRATGKSERDCRAMYLKTAMILAWRAASYVLLVFVAQTWWQAVPAGRPARPGAWPGVGFNIQHDGGHRAYSRRGWVNWLAAMTLDLIGASSYLWHWKHVIFHHTYVNVPGRTRTSTPAALLRLSPHQPRRRFHRWQHLYLWPLYGVMATRWHLYGDFKDVLTGTIGPAPASPARRGGTWPSSSAASWSWWRWLLGVPLLFHPVWVVLAVLPAGHGVMGVVTEHRLPAGPLRRGGRLPAARPGHAADGGRLGGASGGDDGRLRPPQPGAVLAGWAG